MGPGVPNGLGNLLKGFQGVYSWLLKWTLSMTHLEDPTKSTSPKGLCI